MFTEIALYLLFFITFSIFLTYTCFKAEINEYFRIVCLIFRLPQVSKLPVLGVAFKLMTIKEHGLFDFLSNAVGSKRLVADLLVGYPTVILTEPRDLEKIMNNYLHNTKGINYNSIIMWLNEGLLTSYGDKWRLRRKLLTPTFHFRILENCLPVIYRNTTKLVDRLLKAGSEPSCVYSYITECTLATICETAMGITLNEEDASTIQYCRDIKSYLIIIENVERISELIMKRELNAWLRNSIIFAISSTGKEFKATRTRLHNFTNKVIAERRKIFSERKNNDYNQNETEFCCSKKEPKIFLDCLLEVQYNWPHVLSDSDIREEVDTFVFEGHDTTAAAILFALHALGTHKHVQEKALNELEKIFGADQRAPTLSDIKQMVYLECVIKETLRLYPSVPIISRRLTHDLHLDGGIVIPATTNVILLPYFLHRNANIYSNADKFDPDRFLPENKNHLHPYAYIPFSAGPRNCIGQKFALIELKIILSTVLMHTEIESLTEASNLSLAPLLVLRALNPILMTFKARRSH